MTRLAPHWPRLPPPPDFHVGRCVMQLLYAQTVVWGGLFYAPLLPVVFALVLAATFYVERVGLLLTAGDSGQQPWRAAQTQTVYRVFAFLSLLLVGLQFIYSIVGCGRKVLQYMSTTLVQP